MTFRRNFRRSLELLPEELHEEFTHALIETMGSVVGSVRANQCLDVAMWIAQAEEKRQGLRLVKGGKKCQRQA